jgi:GNS1/SUR4 family
LIIPFLRVSDLDKRVKDWLFMSNPFKPVTIIAVYLFVVLKWGPKFMENRQPFKLDLLIKCYNLLQVAFCAYIAIDGYRYSYGRGYNIFCQPVDYSYDPAALRIAVIAHYYFLTKVCDLFDTVFFVLKKKNSHVSFLHVYHVSFVCLKR